MCLLLVSLFSVQKCYFLINDTNCSGGKLQRRLYKQQQTLKVCFILIQSIHPFHFLTSSCLFYYFSYNKCILLPELEIIIGSSLFDVATGLAGGEQLQTGLWLRAASQYAVCSKVVCGVSES